MKLGASISDLVAGFKVVVTSYLYKLDWSDYVSNKFYQDYYYDINTIDLNKKQAFMNEHSLFKLVYLGKFSSSSDKTILRGVSSNEEVIRKVCARSLDKNYAELARLYDVFKVKSPIIKVTDKYVYSPIGMKEGVDESSKFEVLETVMDNNGMMHYDRVGVVRPVKEAIWDNRFMATEEQSDGSKLGSTMFKFISGHKFYPGMFLREIQ